MRSLITNYRFRSALFSLVVLCLFAGAWISDRWPQYSNAALIVACVIVCAQVCSLYFGAKSVSQNVAQPDAISAGQSKEDKIADAFVESFFRSSTNEELGRVATLQRHHLILRNLASHHPKGLPLVIRDWQGHRRITLGPRSSVPETWGATGSIDPTVYRFLLEAMLRNMERPTLPSQIAGWKFTDFGNQVFRVEAGAFEIEVFQGRTNIRVLDTNAVTVEGVRREEKDGPPEIIRAPIYN